MFQVEIDIIHPKNQGNHEPVWCRTKACLTEVLESIMFSDVCVANSNMQNDTETLLIALEASSLLQHDPNDPSQLHLKM